MLLTTLFHPATPALLLPLLLVAQAAAALLWCFWYVPREVFINADMIAADGSANTLHEGFHQRRGWVRFWWWLGFTAAGSLPAACGPWWLWLLAFVGLGWGLAGFFAADFTPALNVARGKARYYVSFAAGAARWPDSKLAAAARAKYPNDPAKQVAAASEALERLTGQLLFVTAAGYGSALAAALFFLHLL